MSRSSLSGIKHEATAESFISRIKHRIASVLNGLKNDPSYEFISEVILKINVVQVEKIKAKVYMIFIRYRTTDMLVISFVFSL